MNEIISRKELTIEEHVKRIKQCLDRSRGGIHHPDEDRVLKPDELKRLMGLPDDFRLKVMRLISENPDMSTRQVADEVGISNGSAYYVLTALVEKGCVKLGNFKKNPRKGQYAYLLTPKGIREKSLLTHSFIERKREEFELLKAEIKALEEEAGLSVEATLSQRGSKQ